MPAKDTLKIPPAPNVGGHYQHETSSDGVIVDAETIMNFRRGIDWLSGELPIMQAFARALTGRDDLRVVMGAMACTDGDTVYLPPPQIKEGQPPPSRKYRAFVYHEVAHAIDSQVFDPPESRDMKNAIKAIGDRKYGVPSGWIWNALEDGRVEERLYRYAPGARKHIAGDVDASTQDIIDSMMVRPLPEGLTEEQIDDMGLILGTYFRSAGYEDWVQKFQPRVRDALNDKQIDQLMRKLHKTRRSIEVLDKLTQPFIKRAKELGFFRDFDDRSKPKPGQGPGTPQVVDWNDLTEEEKEQLREQARQKLLNKDPSKANTIVKNAPQELLDSMLEEGECGSCHQKDGEHADDCPEQGEDGLGAEGQDSAGDGSDSQGEGEEQGEASSAEEGEGEPGQGVGENKPGKPLKAYSKPTQLTDDGTGEPSDSTDDTEEGAVDITMVEQAAKELHEANEVQRSNRVEKFGRYFEQIEEKVRPPHKEMKTKEEAARLEPHSREAQEIKAAQELEVGHIWGAAKDKGSFVFKQRKIEFSGRANSAEIDQYSDVIAGNIARLRAVFKQNEKSSFNGQFEMGTHLNQRALTGFVMKEHLKPFDRRHKPKKFSYAVTLLIDQSGSMAGDKIAMARVSLLMQAEMLHKLGIKFEILGFTTDRGSSGIMHNVYKTFDEPWTSKERGRVLQIGSYNYNLDGFALAWAWERLSARQEQIKILMTYSDGMPAPDSDQQVKIMNYVLSRMAAVGAIAIGIGIQSTAVDRLYPITVHCQDVRTLPKKVIQALSVQLRKKR